MVMKVMDTSSLPRGLLVKGILVHKETSEAQSRRSLNEPYLFILQRSNQTDTADPGLVSLNPATRESRLISLHFDWLESSSWGNPTVRRVRRASFVLLKRLRYRARACPARAICTLASATSSPRTVPSPCQAKRGVDLLRAAQGFFCTRLWSFEVSTRLDSQPSTPNLVMQFLKFPCIALMFARSEMHGL